MKLTHLDLNLLVTMLALLEECHVSRAGQRLGLTQPAMSNALSRLRQLFNDELLVRTPQGMRLTPRAMELATPLRAALDQLEQVLGGESGFDPLSSRRTFTLAMADYTSLVVLPRLKRILAQRAPHIDLVVRNSIRRQGLTLVDRGEADLAIGMLPEPPPHLRSQVLYHDRLVCMARHDHPALARPLDLEAYIILPHVLVRGANEPESAVDRLLERLGHKRRIEVVLPNFLVLPLLLAGTDLVATEPERLALRYSQVLPLAMQAPPFAGPDIHISQAWHNRSDRDPALRWLRERVAEIAAEA
jgi:DNA-binding transcriptional LysR family regulator